MPDKRTFVKSEKQIVFKGRLNSVKLILGWSPQFQDSHALTIKKRLRDWNKMLIQGKKIIGFKTSETVRRGLNCNGQTYWKKSNQKSKTVPTASISIEKVTSITSNKPVRSSN